MMREVSATSELVVFVDRHNGGGLLVCLVLGFILAACPTGAVASAFPCPVTPAMVGSMLSALVFGIVGIALAFGALTGIWQRRELEVNLARRMFRVTFRSPWRRRHSDYAFSPAHALHVSAEQGVDCFSLEVRVKGAPVMRTFAGRREIVALARRLAALTGAEHHLIS
jgi:hypothetical protein